MSLNYIRFPDGMYADELKTWQGLAESSLDMNGYNIYNINYAHIGNNAASTVTSSSNGSYYIRFPDGTRLSEIGGWNGNATGNLNMNDYRIVNIGTLFLPVGSNKW